MNEETKRLIDAMTRQDQEKRLRELQLKHGILEAKTMTKDNRPSHDLGDLDEMEEREYLQQILQS